MKEDERDALKVTGFDCVAVDLFEIHARRSAGQAARPAAQNIVRSHGFPHLNFDARYQFFPITQMAFKINIFNKLIIYVTQYI